MMKSAATAAVAVAALALTAQAQRMSTQCFSNVCYSLNIPEQTAKSGNGDIYFQISAPSSYSWVGLGQGSSMSGSNIFVIYADGQGNVTLSPRQGTGHVEPEHDTTANVTLLEGSGISNGKMVANVLCANCERWNGGTTDFTSSSGNWIHASLPGSAIDSTSVDAEIEFHKDHGSFMWDYSKAQGGSNVNPFVARQGGGSPASTTMGASPTSMTTGVSSAPTSSSSSAPSSDSDSSSGGLSTSAVDMITTAHGTISSVAFLVLMPIGAIAVRVSSLGTWVHAGVQIFAYCVFIAGAGLGIRLAIFNKQLKDYHPIIGMVLLAVLFFQPFFGIIHHRAFKQHSRRTAGSYIHIYVGRIAVVLGMINGGLGIKLAGDVENGYIIAYSVVAGVMGAIFIATIVYGEFYAKKRSTVNSLSSTEREEKKNKRRSPA